MSSSRNTALPLNTCPTASVGFKVREEGREVESDDGFVRDSLCNDRLQNGNVGALCVCVCVCMLCHCISAWYPPPHKNNSQGTTALHTPTYTVDAVS